MVWIAINCHSVKEARVIGKALLKKRLIACYDILPRLTSGYVWPPQSGKVVEEKGVTIMVTTMKKHFSSVEKMVKTLHSDKVPFIAAIPFAHVSRAYQAWLIKELK